MLFPQLSFCLDLWCPMFSFSFCICRWFHEGKRELERFGGGFPGGSVAKNSTWDAGVTGDCRFDPWVKKILWRRAWQSTPVFLPGKSEWTEEPGSLQSIGSQRFGHDWSSLACKDTVTFSSVAQSCPTLWDPMNHSTPGLPVHHQLLEFTQTHVHRVGDAIQPSHPLLSPSPPALNLSQHQGLFKWVSSLH